MLTLVPARQALRAETVGFFYALEADLAVLKSESSGVERTATIAGTAIEVLKLDDHRVVAAKMGAGCVATAVATQAVLAKFPCDAVVSVGPVGSLNDEFPVGTWREVEWVEGYQRGTAGQTGFLVAEAARMPLATPTWLASGLPGGLIVASGETFSASAAFREEVRELTGADAIDMNLYGLVKVCQAYDLPLVAWRVVSDRASEDAGAEFSSFVQDYDGEGGRRAAKIIRALPANPNRPESYDGLRKLLEE